MKKSFWIRLIRWFGLIRLAAIANAGHFFWLIPILVAGMWLAAHEALVVLNIMNSMGVGDVQNRLIGVPLAMLGIFLGLRIVAGEINARTIEIVYTVPGGAKNVWWTKLIAAALLLAVTMTLFAVYIWFRFGPFPIEALYGALQSSVLFLVLAMGFSALFRSEVAGAIVTCVILLIFGIFFHNFGEARVQPIISPFFNPYADNMSPQVNLLAAILKNRIGVAIVIGLVTWLAFMRGERREKLLSA